MKGNKIGSIKLHPIDFCPKFGRSKEMDLQFMKGNKFAHSNYPPLIFVRNLSDRKKWTSKIERKLTRKERLCQIGINFLDDS